MKQQRPPFGDLELTRSAGKKGGTTKAKRRLTLERVQKELPPMDSRSRSLRNHLHFIQVLTWTFQPFLLAQAILPF